MLNIHRGICLVCVDYICHKREYIRVYAYYLFMHICKLLINHLSNLLPII